MTARLIILEGPDGGGKSTLAQNLASPYDTATVVHHGPYPEEQYISQHFMSTLLLPLQVNDLVVMDRCWLSDSVYGPRYRSQASRVSPVEVRVLEDVAKLSSAVVVICLPPPRVCAENSERPGEYVKDPAVRATIYDDYRQMAKYYTGLPIIVHDYTVSTAVGLIGKIKTTVEEHYRRRW